MREPTNRNYLLQLRPRVNDAIAASGVKYVFNNSGSREALFFNELHSRDIHGILGLHEGAVPWPADTPKPTWRLDFGRVVIAKRA